MNAPKFTQGRWYAKAGVSQMVSDDSTIWSAPRTNGDSSRWFVFADADDYGDPQADAALIAAAPELYAALEEMLLQFGIRGGNGTCQKARAALAKARGDAL